MKTLHLVCVILVACVLPTPILSQGKSTIGGKFPIALISDDGQSMHVRCINLDVIVVQSSCLATNNVPKVLCLIYIIQFLLAIIMLTLIYDRLKGCH